MLFSPVFANLQHRPTPPTALPFSSFLAAALLPRRSNVEIEVPPNLWRVDPDPVGTFKRSNVSPIYPFCPQTLADLPTQRPQPNPFEINAFRTLFLATEGYTPSSHFGTHPLLDDHRSSFSFHALTGIHFATPFFSDACRNGGVHPPLHSTFVRFDVQTTLGSRNRARLPRVSSSKRVLAASLFLQGHRRARKKQDHSVSRVPVSFPKQGISSFYTTREKRRMAPGRSGHSWK